MDIRPYLEEEKELHSVLMSIYEQLLAEDDKGSEHFKALLGSLEKLQAVHRSYSSSALENEKVEIQREQLDLDRERVEIENGRLDVSREQVALDAAKLNFEVEQANRPVQWWEAIDVFGLIRWGMGVAGATGMFLAEASVKGIVTPPKWFGKILGLVTDNQV